MIVYYDAARDLIYAERTQRVWPARSLVALPSATDDTVTVAMATSLVPVLGPLTPDLVQRQDGTAFADQGTALAYLQEEFARYGTDQSTTTYQLRAVTSFAARHGLPYAPSIVLIDDDGEVVETDAFCAPGIVTLTFPQPFTGTLYLG